jgi:hypothetical protein
VDHVDAEAVDAALAPEAQDVVHRLLDLRVVPVQVGLLGEEGVQVPLTAAFVARPRAADGGERGAPGVRRPAVDAVAPHVPVAPRAVRAAQRLLEPRMAVGGVVRDEVHDDLDAAPVGLLDEAVEVLQGPVLRVHVAVVGDVVAEVRHGRAVERRQPDRLDAERRGRAVVEVVEASGDPRQVADAVAVGVRERPGVDLVDRTAPPPGRRIRGHDGRATRS